LSEKSSRQKRNPIAQSVYILAVVLSFSILAMTIVLIIPADLGSPYEPLKPGQSYIFDPWEITLGHLHISYPEGGVLVEATRRGELTTFVLLGEGTAHFAATPDESIFPVQQLVLHTHPAETATLRGQTFIAQEVLPEAMHEAATLLESIAHEEPFLEVFGVRKVFLPRRGVARVALFSPEGARATYIQARRTIWQVPDQQPIIISNPAAKQYPPHDQFIFSLTILAVMLAAVAAGVVFVTQQYDPRATYGHAGAKLVWPLGLALLHATVEAVLIASDLHTLVILAWRIMVLAGILWIADTYGDALNFLGCTTKKVLPAIGTGIWCGFLLYLCGTLALPSGLNMVTPEQILNLVYLTVSAALFREILWRGLVQGAFRQHYNAALSIGATTVLAALFSLLPALLAGNFPTAVLIQSFFIVPMSAFMLGFVYERTHNIFAPLATVTTMHVLSFLLNF